MSAESVFVDNMMVGFGSVTVCPILGPSFAKIRSALTKEPFIFIKMRLALIKEPFIFAKMRLALIKEPFIFAKMRLALVKDPFYVCQNQVGFEQRSIKILRI